MVILGLDRDANALAAAAGGSQAAQRALFTAHFDALYAFFRMALVSADDAEAAAVDTLALAIERKTHIHVASLSSA